MKTKDIQNVVNLLKIAKFDPSREREKPKIKDLKAIEFNLPVDLKNILPIIAIDGSYSFLFSFLGAETWIVLFRIAVTKYKFESTQNGIHRYILDGSPKIYDHLNLISFDPKVLANQPQIYKIAVGIAANLMERVPQIVASNILSYLEDKTLEKITEDHGDCIIFKDGALLTFRALERASIYKNVVVNCRMNNISLVGISKSTSTHFFNDIYTDDYFLKRYYNMKYPNLAYIHILPEKFEKQTKFDVWGEVYFAKLHKDAHKWFRIDIGKEITDVENLFSMIAAYSMVKLMPGYPIGLIEAHKVAKSVRDLKNTYELEILESLKHLGLQPEDLLNGSVDFNGRQFKSFHEVLDQLSK